MIVVLPDSKTLHNGSMYSSSVTTETSNVLFRTISSSILTPITAPSPNEAAAG